MTAGGLRLVLLLLHDHWCFRFANKDMVACHAIQPAIIPFLALIRRQPWRTILVQTLVAALSVACLAPSFPDFNTVTILIVSAAAFICFVALLILYSSLVSVFEYRDLLGVGGNNSIETKPVRIVFAAAGPLLGMMYWSWIVRDNSPHSINASILAGALEAAQWVFLFQAVG